MTDDHGGWEAGPIDSLSDTTRHAIEQRGPVVARVVVDVHENGEAVPQVQFPDREPDLDLAARAVASARDALTGWR